MKMFGPAGLIVVQRCATSQLYEENNKQACVTTLNMLHSLKSLHKGNKADYVRKKKDVFHVGLRRGDVLCHLLGFHMVVFLIFFYYYYCSNKEVKNYKYFLSFSRTALVFFLCSSKL